MYPDTCDTVRRIGAFVEVQSLRGEALVVPSIAGYRLVNAIEQTELFCDEVREKQEKRT